MKAMVMTKIVDMQIENTPLTLLDLPTPEPQDNEILVQTTVCGVCHTELDEIEGRTPPNKLPRILGHQTIGNVVSVGKNAHRFINGTRVGVAWIFSACGHCDLCKTGQENLCPEFKATGRDAHGGYAELITVPEAFAYRIPDNFSDLEAAPHLCAGAIGYRSLKLTNLHDGQTLGLTGFGASAHLVMKLTKYKFPHSKVYVFSRTASEREFALEIGAAWAGDIQDSAPEPLDCIIDTTPVWKPVIKALGNLAPGGRLVINAIRKEFGDKNTLLSMDYAKHLWMEKEIKSVANVTRQDVQEYLNIAAQIPLIPKVQEYALEDANQALMELKARKIRGAKVLRIS